MDSIVFDSSLVPPPLQGRDGLPLRDPQGSTERYDRDARARWSDEKYASHIIEELTKGAEIGSANLAAAYAMNNVGEITARLVYMYARGDQLIELVDRLRVDLPYVLALRRLQNQLFYGLDAAAADARGMYGNVRRDLVQRLAFPLLLASVKSQLDGWVSLFRQDAEQQDKERDERSYFMDVLIRAFVPDWPVELNEHTLPKRGRAGERYEVMQALFRTLAQPTTEARSRAMAQYMSQWNRMMRRYGWKPRRVFHPLRPDGSEPRHPRSDKLFVEFAFEAALAVCAYDLDDRAFRAHPYYPRDLVDYYQTRIRHTRDAWRPPGVGAGLVIEAPPLPRKLDLSASRSTGIVRWVELVCDGDADAVEAVIAEVGNPDEVDESSSLYYELAQNRAAICVDIKDDETLAIQIDDIVAARKLGDFDVDAVPGAGPARCVAMLQALDQWLTGKPHRLVALHDDGDAWVAALVPQAYDAEFTTLSRALNIPTFEPRQVFRE